MQSVVTSCSWHAASVELILFVTREYNKFNYFNGKRLYIKYEEARLLQQWFYHAYISHKNKGWRLKLYSLIAEAFSFALP